MKASSQFLRVVAPFVFSLGLSLHLSAQSAPTPQGTTSIPGASVASTRPSINIYNFGQVSQTYYRGAQPQGRDYTDLAALGVKTVIDLQADGDSSEPNLVEAAGMKYVRIPMTTHVPPTPGKLRQFLAIVNDPASQPVYVHCREGRHRTGVMTAVYRMTGEAWTADRAFKEMKQFRFGADFLHPQFKRFVYAFRPETAPTLAVGTPATVPANGVIATTTAAAATN